MGITRFNRPVINVKDADRTIAFYRDLLGMKLVSDNSTKDPDKPDSKVRIGNVFGVSDLDLRWVVLEVPTADGAGREVEFLQWNNPKPFPLPGQRTCYDAGVSWCAFRVEGLKALYDKLKSKGTKFLGPLTTFGTERGICYAIDPDGYIVELGGTL